MTNEDLYRILAHADPVYLAHSEAIVRRQSRVIPRILATAAVVAVLTCTAFAIPAVRNYILGLIPNQTHTAAVVETPSGREAAYVGVLDVTPDVTIPEDAPEFLETYYVPTYLAAHWTPVVQERYAPQTQRRDVLLQWQSEDGAVISFRQDACPGYDGSWAYDTLPTGYDDHYTIAQAQYGGLTLWTIAVGPSQAETAEGMEQFDGYRKFYWSDGQYLFSLETAYDTSDTLLEEIFSSIRAVEDLAPYESVDYVEPPAVTEPEAHEIVRIPTFIPEGFQLDMGTLAWGCYEFYWTKPLEDGTRITLELVQREDWDEGTIQQWETTTEPHTKAVATVGDWTVTIYAREGKTEALWQTEDCNYVLTSRGPEALPAEEVLRVIESLEIVDDVTPYLT